MKKLMLVAMILVVGLLPTAIFAQDSGLPGTGWFSGEQIQNVGAGSTNVTITAFGTTSGEFEGGLRSLATGASTTYLPDDFEGMSDGFTGSAVVSSNPEPIVGIVNSTGVYQASKSHKG